MSRTNIHSGVLNAKRGRASEGGVSSSGQRLAQNEQTNKHNALYCTIKVTLRKWMLLMFLWAREYHVTDVADDAEVSRRVVIDTYGWFCDVCTNQLLA